MSFGKGSNTTTSQTAPNAQAYAAYSGLLGQAAGVASTPYQAYTGQLTAPVNSQQTTGINAINQNAGFASPYIQQAASYATQAAQPVTASQIAGYESPYTQQVVNATQAEFNNQNAQQQSALTGNAVSAGALGGDRAGVAAANLAGQQSLAQAPVIAGLENTGYQNASQTALAEQSNLGNAAYSLGNLGVAGQNAALTGANAQVGAGTLQQQTQQAQDTAAYQQFEQQLAYPFQTTQWLAGIDTGVGSQMGGTSSTTAPPPNVLAQLLGLGVAGAGLFAPTKTSATGGRVAGFDGGGAVNFIGGMPYSGINGYVPSANITSGSGAPKAPGVAGGPAGPTLQQFGQAGKGLASLFGGNSGNAGTGADIDWDQNFGEGWKRGGGVHGFADGGGDTFADRFDAAAGPNAGGGLNYDPVDAATFLDAGVNGPNAYPLTGDDPLTKSENNFGFDFNPTRTDANLATAEGLPGEGDVDIPANATTTVGDAEGLLQGQDALRRKAGVNGSPDLTSYAPVPGTAGAPALAPSGVAGAPSGVAPTTKADAKKEAGFGFGFLSPEAKIGLMSAGLGMMASRSPFLGTAIGEGGLAGLSAYSGQVKQNASIEDARKKLEQSAKQHADQLALETKKLSDAAEARQTMTPHQKAEIELKRSQIEQGKLPAGYERIEGGMRPIPGGPADPDMAKKLADAKRQAGTAFDDDTVKVMADAIQKGNVGVLTNLGAGAQKAENVAKIWNEVARRVVEAGGTGGDLNAARANFNAQMGAAKSQATRAANVEANIEEARQTFPLALEASHAVPRTTWVPLNRAIQMVQAGSSSPELARFVTANAGVVTAYSQAMARAGIATVDGRHAAEALLSTATGPEAYEAVLQQMEKEMQAAATAPEMVRQAIMARISGRPAQPGGAPGAQQPAGASPAPQEGERKQFKQGWGVFHGGQWVPAGANP